MKIEISGSRCISCAKYTQYYSRSLCTYEMEPINRGYCGQRQCVTQPGNRCKKYREKSNVGTVYLKEQRE
ncbi:hypothetical protein LQE92_08985 [Lacrimispora sp. NSJ-141]|uniref:Uncharacterized protein n=1 Tax=Lientehia hominis TaxID=2897778 RepID=A0AAP2WA42_9FIRM|nr:hypothetical protein [Lientehia hominis]MCD2492762.1 hypothetical protein [Lientehia hominis]